MDLSLKVGVRFVWVDIDGEPLVLPDCFTPLYENQYVLSGVFSAYKAVQRGHGRSRDRMHRSILDDEKLKLIFNKP